MTQRKWLWPLLLLVFVGAMTYGSWPRATATSQAATVSHIASQIRCPTCNGLSVEESDAPLAQSAKEEITRQVAAGNSEEQIKTYFVSVYGNTALMTAPREGIAAAAWALPVLFVVLGAAGVAYAVIRWRRTSSQPTPTDDDRALVDAALRGER